MLLLYVNALGDEGAKALAMSEQRGGLRVLSLGLNGIGKKGARAVAKSTTLAGLTGLDLRGNDIDEKTAAKLTERFGRRVLLEDDWKPPRGQPQL